MKHKNIAICKAKLLMLQSALQKFVLMGPWAPTKYLNFSSHLVAMYQVRGFSKKV